MEHYKYSQTWFLDSEIKTLLFTFLKKSTQNKILEIGSFEGLSSVFFADNFLDNPNSFLVCVDPFLSIDHNDHVHFGLNEAEINFNFNISICKNANKIITHKTSSDDFFKNNKLNYTFIYIDGCHEPSFIKRDLENAYLVLEENGIMWMDDYRGGDGKIKNTIDEFVNKYNCKIIHKGYQLAIQKSKFV